jgi:hypothetical protein
MGKARTAPPRFSSCARLDEANYERSHNVNNHPRIGDIGIRIRIMGLALITLCSRPIHDGHNSIGERGVRATHKPDLLRGLHEIAKCVCLRSPGPSAPPGEPCLHR